MIKISKPLIKSNAKQIYQACVNSYSSKRKRDELSAYESKVDLASLEYDKYIPNEFDKFAHPTASKEETKDLIGVYKYMFLGKRCGGFYDKIIANVNQVCPFCGEGRAITLDHFLPKAEYPFLVVTPENLVPSCRDCNMEKGDEKPTCNEEVPLHPYYDDIDSVWLEANIDYSKADNLDFEFVNNLDKTVEPLLFKRIDVHMRVHDLKANFSTHATSAINSKKRIHLQDAKQGVNRLHNELERELKSFEAEDVNSWRSALYRGLIRSIDKYVEWLLHLPSRYH